MPRKPTQTKIAQVLSIHSRPADPTTPRRCVRDPDGQRALLDFLRHTASLTRCKSYVDLFGACAMLVRNREVAVQTVADVLMRSLSQALGRRPVMLRQGEAEVSFDEEWLLALARGIRGNDALSVAFLLNSRVPKHAHRNLVFLVSAIAEAFELA